MQKIDELQEQLRDKDELQSKVTCFMYRGFGNLMCPYHLVALKIIASFFFWKTFSSFILFLVKIGDYGASSSASRYLVGHERIFCSIESSATSAIKHYYQKLCLPKSEHPLGLLYYLLIFTTV